jgi:hypothetical protein
VAENYKWFWYVWLRGWEIFISDLECKTKNQEEEMNKHWFSNHIPRDFCAPAAFVVAISIIIIIIIIIIISKWQKGR